MTVSRKGLNNLVVRAAAGKNDTNKKGAPGSAFFVIWRGCLVTVVIGLVRALHLHADVLGLLLRQRRQIDAQLL
jgi:hypothetical protein